MLLRILSFGLIPSNLSVVSPIIVTKMPDRATWRRREVVWITFLKAIFYHGRNDVIVSFCYFDKTFYSKDWGWVSISQTCRSQFIIDGIQVKNLSRSSKQISGRNIAHWFVLWLALLTEPRNTCVGMLLPTEDCVLPRQLILKVILSQTFHKPSWWDDCSNEVLVSPVILGCVKLTINRSWRA